MNTTPRPASGDAITYASAGVDTAAGDRAVELMKEAVAATHGPDVLGGIGAFAGLVDVSALKDYRRPLLASSTDGVGMKIAIAREMDVHDTIGRDLVGMVVDDIVVVRPGERLPGSAGSRPACETRPRPGPGRRPRRAARRPAGSTSGCRWPAPACRSRSPRRPVAPRGGHGRCRAPARRRR